MPGEGENPGALHDHPGTCSTSTTSDTGTAPSCTPAADCHGVLPHFCLQRSDGTAACTHWVQQRLVQHGHVRVVPAIDHLAFVVDAPSTATNSSTSCRPPVCASTIAGRLPE